jgi:hypothetical protein
MHRVTAGTAAVQHERSTLVAPAYIASVSSFCVSPPTVFKFGTKGEDALNLVHVPPIAAKCSLDLTRGDVAPASFMISLPNRPETVAT